MIDSFRVSGRAAVALFVLAAAAPVHARAEVVTGLQAFWDFNAGAGDQDSSIHDRDLTLRSNPNAYGGAGAAPTVSSGGVGGGTAFDMPARVYDARMGAPGTFYGDFFGPSAFTGGDAFRPDSGSGTDPFDLNAPAGYAVQTWVNFDELPMGIEQTLLAKTTDMATSAWQGWNLSQFRNSAGIDRITFAARTGAGVMELRKELTLATDAWYHILVNATVAGPNMAYDLYVNGSLVSTHVAGAVNAVGEPLYLGHINRSYGGVGDLWLSPLRGSLDQVAFWDRSLTSGDVAALYNGGQGFSFSGGPAPVPEPATLALAGVGAAAAVGRRRASRRA